MTRREIIIISILAAVQFFHLLDFMIIMPLANELIETFHINATQFSLIVSSYSISAGSVGLLGSVYIDHLDRKKALIIAFAGFLIGTLFCAIATNYELLVASRIVSGGFGGLISALIFAIVGDEIPDERRAEGMSYVMMAFAVCSVIGVPLGLLLSNAYGWNFPFIAIVSLGTLLFLGMFFLLKPMRKHLTQDYVRTSLLTSAKTIFSQQQLVFGLAFMFFLVLGQFTVIPFITPFLIRNIGMTPEQIPLVYLIGGGSAIISSPLIGKLADRIGRKNVFYWVAPCSVLTMLVLTNLTAIPVYYVLVVNAVMFVTVSGRMIPANTLLTTLPPPELRGAYMGFVTAILNISSGLSSFLAGNVVKIEEGTLTPIENYPYTGIIAAGASFVSIVILTRVKEPLTS